MLLVPATYHGRRRADTLDLTSAHGVYDHGASTLMSQLIMHDPNVERADHILKAM
jgi:hypothetical protein